MSGLFPRRTGTPGRAVMPSGIAGRVTLVIVGLAVVAMWVSAAFYARDRAKTTIQLFSESVAYRIGVIVPLLEEASPAARPKLLQALNSPTLWIGMTDGPRPRIPRGWRTDTEFEEEIAPLLPELADRRIIIRKFHRWGPSRDATPPMPGRLPAPPDLFNSRVKVLAAVAMKSGGWVYFVAASDTTSLRWAMRMLFWMVVATVLILVVSFWAVHRMTRPLRRFADAAERIGLDVRSPPLPERGSRELRNATRAFNQMQERLRRFVDDRTMMLAAISHDLRTMLTRLKLRAEFIEDSEQQNKAIADLDEMQAMLDSTLAFARDDAADELRTLTDLAALIGSLCDDIADTGAAVTCTGPDKLPYNCAPGAIKRAVDNIVTNAVKYGDCARISLSTDAERIEITVQDSGPGITAAQREDVFRPFYRLEESRNRETGGSGLGLAVARSIVRRHGGDILLEDGPDGGLLARILLPHTPMP